MRPCKRLVLGGATSKSTLITIGFLFVCVLATVASSDPETKPNQASAPAKADELAPAKIESPPASVAIAPQTAQARPDPEVKPALATQNEPSEVGEAAKRKARSEASPSQTETSKTSSEASKVSAEASKAESTGKSATKQSSASDTKSSAKGSKSPTATSPKPATKSKLPANLGTVTSTGSSLYLSKHDAYSAIAEKHGSIVHDAMRKSDKQRTSSSSSSPLHRFAGIQKASAFSDNFNPFKGDSGLARTLGASMRSIMKSKYSVPAYVASALLGAVALMAFYESPISPLPVPPLPEPPVGRFPPEMPNIPVGTQVPFRTNQQQMNYNQRIMPNSLGQVGQQVMFPGQAQQRSGQVFGGVPGGSAGQLAASLLGKQQVAQRKSGPDYEPSLTRSLFSGANMSPAPGNQASGQQSSKSAPSMSQPQAVQRASNSFLNMLGLGGENSAPTTANLNPGGLESKSQSGQSGSYTGSSIINRVKSYFTRVTPQASSLPSPPSPSDPYQRMSFVQALIKETNFLPNFLNPNRKATSASSSSSSSSSSNNKAQPSSSAAASPANSQQAPAARMQVDNQPLASAKSKTTPGSYGLVKAADRIAHALLETWTSGLNQRSASSQSSSPTADNSYQKSNGPDESASASLATSLLSDLMSNYGSSLPATEQAQQQSPSSVGSPQSQDKAHTSSSQQSQAEGQASGRASDAPALITEDSQPHVYQNDQHHSVQHSQQQPKVSETQKQQVIKSASAPVATQIASESGAGKVRKTRSIGLEYPIESNQELNSRQTQPSRATQINNVIDYVSDSYAQNRLLINFVMNQVGLSQAVPYMERILGPNGAVTN